jgi:hypothetical protein
MDANGSDSRYGGDGAGYDGGVSSLCPFQCVPISIVENKHIQKSRVEAGVSKYHAQQTKQNKTIKKKKAKQNKTKTNRDSHALPTK